MITDVRLDHLAVARHYAATPDTWSVTPRYDPADRWYHRLATTDDYEVWLLTWLPGQGTDLHDHGGSAGAFLLHSGTLTEDTVSAPGPDSWPRIVSRELGEGAGRRFGSHHIHRVINRSAEPAISIHVYGPALTTMTRYRLTESGLSVANVERAGAQW
jgi:predicted metal-dependent enzyme (double-stranded beta helix superfamily)